MATIALSCGEPAGIGPEIAIDAWAARRGGAVPPFCLIGDPDLIAARARRTRRTVSVVPVSCVGEAEAVFEQGLPVLPLAHSFTDSPGRPEPSNAAGVIASITRAVGLWRTGEASAIVTCPIAKKPLYEAGFRHPGHTEFLAELADPDKPPRSVMMLAGPQLRAVPVTIHIPLAEVPARLSTELIVETVRIVARDLSARFAIRVPRIAVAGLNPHAGEEGSMGREEIDIIAPAVAMLVREGIDTRGPLPADTMFHPAARARYDAAICMYHDQALIPAKALAFDETVNVTLGLPFIRTSPDHGTAFDIAGTGTARPDSLIAALRLARAMADHEAGAA